MNLIMMSPNNAECVVAIPLYRRSEEEFVTSSSGSTVSIKLFTQQEEPDAYIIDCGSFASVFSAEWVEDKLMYVCDL